MIRVFMGDQNPLHLIRIGLRADKRLHDPRSADACIDKKSRTVRTNKIAVPAAAAGKGAKSQSHFSILSQNLSPRLEKELR
jgi:hypothetical protein